MLLAGLGAGYTQISKHLSNPDGSQADVNDATEFVVFETAVAWLGIDSVPT